mgnify:CR=1 FL=1
MSKFSQALSYLLPSGFAWPREALPEIGKSLYALRKIRTPAQVSAVVDEIEHLVAERPDAAVYQPEPILDPSPSAP